jgi:pimeloyl-ACP methyl ester carboxylesterase
MPVVRANGLAFHTQLLGASGPRLAMLHGLVVGSMAEWYFGAAPRLAKDYQVLLYDLRGHGRSEVAPSGYDVKTQAGDLDALLDGASDVTLVGHSWGALVALRFALDHPGRVRRLVVIEAPLPPAAVPELDGILADPAAALPAPLAEAARSGQRRGQRLAAAVARLAFGTTLLDDVRREPDIPDAALSGLRTPTLLVYGRTSGCRPAGERLARTLPDSELVLLDGGHFLTGDARGALADLLEERLCPR